MEILIVDVGNTRIKWAVYENQQQVFFKTTLDKEIAQTIQLIKELFPQLLNGICVSVRNISDLKWLNEFSFLRMLDRNDDFPFLNEYATPDTLGLDRMVLAAGAVFKFPNENRLVIDAGSCITYDFINQNNVYLGGGISPGLEMRYKAMHEFTAKLPRLHPENPDYLIGNTTAQSMHVGATKGLVFEIDAYIDALMREYGNIKIILTGGDAVFLAKQLKKRLFALPNFLLESLLSIYEYQNNIT